jgi:hypothetical protein
MKSIRYFRQISLFLGGIFLIFSFQSCKLDPREGLSWDSDFLTPIAYSTVNLGDLVTDTSLYAVDGNNAASLVFRDTLASARLSDLVELPDTSLSLVATLDSLSLDPGPIEQRVTLADLARQLIATGDPINGLVGNTLLNSHDSTIQLLPFSGLSFGQTPVDASQFFEFAIVESGELKLTIDNQLPIDIANLQFKIENISGSLILSDTFPLIPKRTQLVEYYDMAGKTIESQLVASLDDMTILGGTALIDTNAYISIRLEPVDLKVESAKAIFPGQTVLDSLQETVYEFPNEFADVELTKAVVASGRLQAFSKSYIEDTVEFVYSLPSATRNGEVPTVRLKLLPAVNGVPSVQEQVVDLSGFTLDMTNGGTTFNTLLQAYQVNLLYSGKLVEIEKTDTISVSFGLLDLEPTYVEGYIGQDEVSFSGEEALDLFGDLDFEQLKFSSPKASLVFSNSLGVDNQVKLTRLEASNSETGVRVPLLGPANRSNSPVIIPGPDLPDTNGVVTTVLSFDSDNGNLDDFINVLPDLISYDFSVLFNYNGQPGLHNNFASEQSEVSAFAEFELPLEGVLENFQLFDTAEVSFEVSSTEDLERINSGFMRIILENQFPFEGIMTATLLDQDYRPIQELAKETLLQAGVGNAQGYVEAPTRTVIQIPFDREQLQRIIEESRFVSFRYLMNSSPSGEPVRLYNDYLIQAKIVGQFNVGIE